MEIVNTDTEVIKLSENGNCKTILRQNRCFKCNKKFNDMFIEIYLPNGYKFIDENQTVSSLFPGLEIKICEKVLCVRCRRDERELDYKIILI